MKRKPQSARFGRVLPLALAATVLPVAAQAYVGPGAGLTAIGTVIALLAAVILAVVGFVWYPVKRLMAKRRGNAADSGAYPVKDAGE